MERKEIEDRVVSYSAHLLNVVNSLVFHEYEMLQMNVYLFIYNNMLWEDTCGLKYRYIGFNSNIGLSKFFFLPHLINTSTRVKFFNSVKDCRFIQQCMQTGYVKAIAEVHPCGFNQDAQIEMKKQRTSGFDYACICSSISVCKGKYVLASLNTCSFTDTVPWLNFMLKAFIKRYCLSTYQFNSCHSIIQEYFPGLGNNCIC